MEKIILPDSIKYITTSAFENNEIYSIRFSKNLKILEKNVFFNNKLTSIEIPETIEEIESNAFGENKIKYIHFNGILTYLDDYAFYNNPVETIEFDVFDYSFIVSALKQFNKLKQVIINDNISINEYFKIKKICEEKNISLTVYNETLLEDTIESKIIYVDMLLNNFDKKSKKGIINSILEQYHEYKDRLNTPPKLDVNDNDFGDTEKLVLTEASLNDYLDTVIFNLEHQEENFKIKNTLDSYLDLIKSEGKFNISIETIEDRINFILFIGNKFNYQYLIDKLKLLIDRLLTKQEKNIMDFENIHLEENVLGLLEIYVNTLYIKAVEFFEMIQDFNLLINGLNIDNNILVGEYIAIISYTLSLCDKDTRNKYKGLIDNLKDKQDFKLNDVTFDKNFIYQIDDLKLIVKNILHFSSILNDLEHSLLENKDLSNGVISNEASEIIEKSEKYLKDNDTYGYTYLINKINNLIQKWINNIKNKGSLIIDEELKKRYANDDYANSLRMLDSNTLLKILILEDLVKIEEKVDIYNQKYEMYLKRTKS